MASVRLLAIAFLVVGCGMETKVPSIGESNENPVLEGAATQNALKLNPNSKSTLISQINGETGYFKDSAPTYNKKAKVSTRRFEFTTSDFSFNGGTDARGGSPLPDRPRLARQSSMHPKPHRGSSMLMYKLLPFKRKQTDSRRHQQIMAARHDTNKTYHTGFSMNLAKASQANSWTVFNQLWQGPGCHPSLSFVIKNMTKTTYDVELHGRDYKDRLRVLGERKGLQKGGWYRYVMSWHIDPRSSKNSKGFAKVKINGRDMTFNSHYFVKDGSNLKKVKTSGGKVNVGYISDRANECGPGQRSKKYINQHLGLYSNSDRYMRVYFDAYKTSQKLGDVL